MARKAFEALNKAKKQEASARAAKRRAVGWMNDEYASAVRKYFPELEASETVDDEIVPVVEDVDKFFEKVARVYHAYRSKGESSTRQPFRKRVVEVTKCTDTNPACSIHFSQKGKKSPTWERCGLSTEVCPLKSKEGG